MGLTAGAVIMITNLTGAILIFEKELQHQGQRIRVTFKPVHVSSIFGIPPKLIGFIACLPVAFFHLSGIIMWLNRKRKKKQLIK